MINLRNVAYQAGAIVTAVLIYMGAAVASGWMMSPVLGRAPDWPRVMAVAVGSTIVGMLISWMVTSRLFAKASGPAVAAAFVCITTGIYAYAWSRSGQAPTLVPSVQSLLLVSLACVLFLKKRR